MWTVKRYVLFSFSFLFLEKQNQGYFPDVQDVVATLRLLQIEYFAQVP